MTSLAYSPSPDTRRLLARAAHRHSPFSLKGLRERAFTMAFSSLVYPQIWEDPVVDMQALMLEPDHHMLVIASGGCNALSYLTGNPASVTAVDLNGAHVALNRLKQSAFRAGLDDDEIDRFLVSARDKSNVALYEQKLRPHLDDETRAYWETRPVARRRIDAFETGLYRTGLLGRFIGTVHKLARLFGIRLEQLLQAQTLDEQRHLFDTKIRPVLHTRLVKSLLKRRASLYGLGIPPQQYEALAEGRAMVDVITERAEKIICGFAFKDNYFAWQALSRAYSPAADASLPPYLERHNRPLVRERINRLTTKQMSLLDDLKARPAASLDRYVLLDAQDWMNDTDLTALWREITRTAKPKARVIFRTAGIETILPGRVPQAILSHWHYEEALSQALHAKDRSAIYGGFHLYVLNDEG